MPKAKALKKSKRGIFEPLETATSLHEIFTSFTIFIVFQCLRRRHVPTFGRNHFSARIQMGMSGGGGTKKPSAWKPRAGVMSVMELFHHFCRRSGTIGVGGNHDAYAIGWLCEGTAREVEVANALHSLSGSHIVNRSLFGECNFHFV